MMFTLLGVIALLLRERRVNNAHSDQDDEVDQNDVPPVRNSDGRETDNCGEDPSLEEPSDDQSEEPSQKEPADDQSEPSQEEPDDGQKEPSQEEPVDGENEPQEEPANDQGKDPSQEEPVDGENEPQEEPANDQGKEPSQEEPVDGENEPQEEPANDQGKDPSQEEPVDGENELPQDEPADDQGEEPSLEEPSDDQSEEPSQEEPTDDQSEPSQEEPDDGQKEPSQEEPVDVENEPQEEPADDQGKEPSQEEPSNDQSDEPSQGEPDDGQKEPSQEEPVDDQSEPSQEEPVDDQSEPSQEEPVDGENEPQEEPVDDQGNEPSQEEPDVPPVSNSSSASSVFYSASCHCGSSKDKDKGKDAAPQASTSLQEHPVPLLLRQRKKYETFSIEIHSRHYKINYILGEGGFGAVYAATRIEDNLPVAIKFAIFTNKKCIKIDGFDNPLPAEIALHFLANQGPKVKEIIELLDWQVEPKRYIMVLEHPMPSQSLFSYWINYNGNIEENILRKIMHHVTIAAETCCQRQVFHRDIKLQNLLINPDTLRVKLIDFGCGELLNTTGYSKYSGTRRFCPPEYMLCRKYYGESTTVWSLGIVLYLLIFRVFPEMPDLHKIGDNMKKMQLSKECCNFLQCCLKWDYKQRIDLKNLSHHNWFKMDRKK